MYQSLNKPPLGESPVDTLRDKGRDLAMPLFVNKIGLFQTNLKYLKVTWARVRLCFRVAERGESVESVMGLLTRTVNKNHVTVGILTRHYFARSSCYEVWTAYNLRGRDCQDLWHWPRNCISLFPCDIVLDCLFKKHTAVLQSDSTKRHHKLTSDCPQYSD